MYRIDRTIHISSKFFQFILFIYLNRKSDLVWPRKITQEIKE